MHFHDRILVTSLKLVLLAIRNKFLKDWVLPDQINELRSSLIYLLRLTPIDIDSYENEPISYVW